MQRNIIYSVKIYIYKYFKKIILQYCNLTGFSENIFFRCLIFTSQLAKTHNLISEFRIVESYV